MPVPGLSLLGPKRIRGFVSILRYINPTIIIIINLTEQIQAAFISDAVILKFNALKQNNTIFQSINQVIASYEQQAL